VFRASTIGTFQLQNALVFENIVNLHLLKCMHLVTVQTHSTFIVFGSQKQLWYIWILNNSRFCQTVCQLQ